MSRESVILVTLVAYKLILIGIGFWASRRTQTTEDFFIGGKTLGPWVAAVSSSASASSAWSLLGVSGAACAMGLSSLLLFPAVVGGYVFNWLWLAPRIRNRGNKSGAVTLTELLAGKDNWTRLIVFICSFAIVFSFAFYIAAQFQAAGSTFSSSFGISVENAIITGTAIILIYTLLGGFWAVSVTDTIQGMLMAVVAIVLPAAALYEVGGPAELVESMTQVFDQDQLSISSSFFGYSAVAFVIGLLGVGLGNPGQPHVVNRFMAIKDERSMRIGKYIGIAWPVIVYGGMLILGLCARVLMPSSEDNEKVLFEVTNRLFHPIVAGVIIAAVLSAIMSTADSQLLVSASSLSYDLNKTLSQKKSLLFSRFSVFVMCSISLLIALYAPQAIFSRVLFAWAAIGSAFAPLLIVMLMGYNVNGPYRFAAILSGFTLTVIFNWLENTPGDVLERVVPFVLAFAIAWIGRKQPDLTTQDSR
ncbi:MAG: sodium/proline symporter [Paraglaciecola sp.]|uniref:sodium/proline symporter n=1 Tax=Paraglaciecola sp. TaxID=1920173 RepID=UPI003298BFD8